MPGAMQIAALFLVGAWILTLCPRASSTSMGHPLPIPLKENRLSPQPSGSSAPAVNKERTSLPASVKPSQEYLDDDDDYEDYLLTVEPRTPGSPKPLPRLCNYNHCQHLQVPCVELSRASECLCPGITGPDLAPEPPRLQTVHVSETGASLRWCAPSSTVQEYRLQYQPVGGAFVSGPALNSTFRLMEVSGLLPSQEYLFCIVASNQAGSSPTDDGTREHGPCRLIRTSARWMPYVYIAAGLAAALVLVTISALVWHFCFRNKRKDLHRGSLDNILDGEPGLQGAANSSFRSEEQL
ncbi:LRRN4 C-terminal-like protein [Rhineura floridana]|uniref:LRRN4 C-terminal-like protein n=1 Tax=Rhineura floridana TaxID=261503 RepID=UPI002AC7F85B|nr:LRRN4 C-terminal-like protein [Rhineura floridana]